MVGRAVVRTENPNPPPDAGRPALEGTISAGVPRGRRIKAVIFDLDGTLIESPLDFDSVRREIGGIDGPVLEALEEMEPSRRLRAEEILERHEAEAAAEARPKPGALEVVQALRRAGLRVAVLTRNSRRSLETVLARCPFPFDAAHTRDDGPVKPSPEPVLSLCRALGVHPEETAVVGDYLFDLQAARGAGAIAVLLRNPTNGAFAPQADRVIENLEDVFKLCSE